MRRFTQKIILGLTLIGFLNAQEIEVVTLEYTQNASPKVNGEQVDQSKYVLILAGGYPINEKLLFITQSRIVKRQYGSINYNGIKGGDLYKAGLMVGFDYTFNETSKLRGVLFNKFTSNEKFTLDKEHYGAMPGLLYYHKIKPNFTIGAGLLYSFEYGSNSPIPIMLLDYASPNEKHVVVAMLPGSFKYSYKWKPKIEVGLIANYLPEEYKLTEGSKHDYVFMSEGTVTAYTQFRASEYLALRVEGGRYFSNELEVYDFGGEKKNRDDDFLANKGASDIESSFFMRVSLIGLLDMSIFDK